MATIINIKPQGYDAIERQLQVAARYAVPAVKVYFCNRDVELNRKYSKAEIL